MNIDLNFARAAIVLPKEFEKVSFFVIGAGGTGSFAAHHIARLGFELKRTGKTVEITIIDPDRVERGNIPRSNFCFAEEGAFKAQTLAERLAAAWGLEIGYSAEKLDFEKHLSQVRRSYRNLTILVGCVDNFEARSMIHESLSELEGYTSTSQTPGVWWVDGGNGRNSGQVLFGSDTKIKKGGNHYFSAPSICRSLPAPSILHPELLEPEKKVLGGRESRENERLSCAERIRLGEQSLNINSRVAGEIGEMLSQFLLTNSLKRFAAYFDLESGTSRSLYCTPEEIGRALPERKRRKNSHV